MDGIELDPRDTREWLGAFVLNYYRSGERARLGEALRYAAGLYGDRLAAPAPGEDPFAGGLALYFFARVGRLDPSALPEYEALCLGPPGIGVKSAESRRFVETVLWLARAERTGPAPQVLPAYFPVGLDVLGRPPRNAPDLDYLWTEFCATGRREPVLQVLDVLRWPDRIRERLRHWLATPAVGRLGRCRRQRRVRRLERLAGIRCDPDAGAILTPGDLDCLCTVGPQAQRDFGRFQAIRAALPFSLNEDDVTAIVTKGAARWSFLSLLPNHPAVRDVWQAEMAGDIDQTIATEAS